MQFQYLSLKKMNIEETPTIPAYIYIGKLVIEKKLFCIDDYKMSSIGKKGKKNRGDSKAVATILL